MGSRGPLHKVASNPNLALVEGDTTHRPPPKLAKLPPKAPDKPDGMDKIASDKWDEIVNVLAKYGMASEIDGAALEMACKHYARAKVAERFLAEQGPTWVNEVTGTAVKNPAAQVFKENSLAFLEYAKVCGLTYAARARLPAPGGGDDDNDGSSPFDA